jgi:Family of unknown function (DUF5946)
VAYALVGLHLALDRGVPGVEVRAAHQRMGRPDASWPRLPAPRQRGELTVLDVAAAGAMVDPPVGHARAVRAWAAAVWQAWAAEHAAVAALTRPEPQAHGFSCGSRLRPGEDREPVTPA